MGSFNFTAARRQPILAINIFLLPPAHYSEDHTGYRVSLVTNADNKPLQSAGIEATQKGVVYVYIFERAVILRAVKMDETPFNLSRPQS